MAMIIGTNAHKRVDKLVLHLEVEFVPSIAAPKLTTAIARDFQESRIFTLCCGLVVVYGHMA